jgi:hypothetical protein
MKFMRQAAGWTSPPAPYKGMPFRIKYVDTIRIPHTALQGDGE